MRPDILALAPRRVVLLSSTIPYALELVALRRLAASAFAILMSLGPATASIAGSCCSVSTCRGSSWPESPW